MTSTVPFKQVERQQFNLLQRLKIWLVVLLAADGLFFFTIVKAQREQQDVVKQIGTNAAPSVIAARKIAVALADMDAEAANEMLVLPSEGTEAVKNYEKRRGEAAEALIAAAKNITYDGEWEVIKDLQEGFGRFETKVQQARDFHDRGDLPQAMEAYRQASSMVEARLLPSAEELNQINHKQLEKTYGESWDYAQALSTISKVMGFALLAALVVAQFELYKRTRRLLNPSLAGASLATLILLSSTASHLAASHRTVQVAKQDAYDSLSYLWKARALAFAANADESKYLLGGAEKRDDSNFRAKAREIAQLLKNEKNNITFAGEGDAAEQAISAWENYLQIDLKIRQLQIEHQHADAVKLCVGTRPGYSDYAFSEFDKALMKTIDINQKEFDKAIGTSGGEVEDMAKTAAFACGLIAVLSAFGLFVRIREFL